jgi:hypothetical protein
MKYLIPGFKLQKTAVLWLHKKFIVTDRDQVLVTVTVFFQKLVTTVTVSHGSHGGHGDV